MLSCAAIQKLERYGQLAQKRRSVDDFVSSSLKDSRRGNVYALTHLPTWESCLSSLASQTSYTPPHEAKEVDEDGENVHGATAAGDNRAENEQTTHSTSNIKSDSNEYNQTVNIGTHNSANLTSISDSLIYAVSYAVSLNVHHMDVQRFTRGTCSTGKDGDAVKMYQEYDVSNSSTHLEGKVFGTRLSEAVDLQAILGAVVGACERYVTSHMESSLKMTQALIHLLSNALNAFVVATILLHAPTNDVVREGELLHKLCRDSTALIAATVRLLRSAQTRQPSNTLHSVRPCPTLLSQYVAKCADASAGYARGVSSNVTGPMQCVADNSGHASRVCARGGKRDVSLTSRLLEWASVLESGSLTRSLAPLTVFQKLSIVDAIVAETDAANCCMEPEAFRHLLPSLIASAACNRSTRIVVYFRGDDIKLMQNNVRESSEYMMHTHVTTPPVERSTLCSLAHMPEQRKQYGGLLIAAWMASISFFFRSFCMEESWTTFAQEQRRMVWLREQETRRQQRQRKRHDSSGLGNAQGEPISSAASERSGSATSAVGVAKRGENCKPADFENDDDGNNFDDESAVSRFTSLSRMSRASLISTFSKPSMASYHSFLSVIDAANHEGKNAETSLYLHQSEDDNTNLPLILLEEVTLALQNFIAAVDGAGVGSLLLDELGLRSLAWRVIGELFTFIQNTTTASGCAQGNIRGGTSGSTATAGGLPIVFHLGNDLRYNKGMGYEILGLLFAKVVLPQLLTSSTTNNTQSCYFIERALTRCLSAYEVIAPQVIDQNIPSILRIAARVAEARTQNVTEKEGEEGRQCVKEEGEVVTKTLHEFLINLLIRLGKSNQVHIFLDAVVMHILEWSRAKLHNDGGGHEGGEGRAVGEADAVAVALHNIFTHSHVRSALAQACSVSLDPENLLHRLLVYVSGWTADAEEVVASSPTLNVPGPAVNVSTEDWKVRCGTRLAQLQPNDVVFILDIVAAVLAGISFTSISATAILERAAELELTLSTFLVNRLYETFFKGNDDKDANTPLSASKGHRKINSIKRPLFAVSDSSVRLKTRRHLMLYTLHAIYQARALVFCCLQDLGIANVEAYLQMLEDTMWQLRGQVGAVVGSLTIDQLDATMGRNTRMPHAPFTHRLLLMPRMALQRLVLAHAVSVILGVSVGPLSEAGQLASFVLSCMRAEEHGGAMKEEDSSHALVLANSLSEEEWRSLVKFSKPKRLRSTLIWLLHRGFADGRAQEWLSKCLTTCAGTLLESMCNVVMSITDNAVMSYFTLEGCREEQPCEGEDVENVSIVSHIAALNDVLCSLGHVPQWPLLLRRCVDWLLMTSAKAAVKEGQTSCDVDRNTKGLEIRKVVSRQRTLQRHLLQLVLNFLRCEEGVHGLLRRYVHLSYGEEQCQEEHQGSYGKRKRGRRGRDVNEGFLETTGVPFLTVAGIPLEDLVESVGRLGVNGEQGVDLRSNTNVRKGVEGMNEGEITLTKAGVACSLLVRHLFSQQFAMLLLCYCERSEVWTEAAECESISSCSACILQQLYSTALSVCRGVNTTSAQPSVAHEFVTAVVKGMRARSRNGNYAVLSIFLNAMSGGLLAFVPIAKPVANKVAVEERDHKRYRCEDGKQPGAQCSQWTSEAMEEGVLPNVASRWVNLLGDLLVRVMGELFDESHGSEKQLTLSKVFVDLYLSLERVQVHTSCFANRANVNESFEKSGSGAKDVPERQERTVKADSFTLASVVTSLPCASQAIEALQELFLPSSVDSQRRSCWILLRLMDSGNVVTLQMLWVLYMVHHQHNRSRGLAKADVSCEQRSDSDHWLIAILNIFDPRREYGRLSAGAKDEYWRWAGDVILQDWRSSPVLKLSALQQEPVSLSDSATRWLSQQLSMVPGILHAFANSSTPLVIEQYIHALLQAAICPANALSKLNTPCWERQKRLLLSAGEALQALSVVPHMKFSLWCNDVKRLLLAGGGTVLFLVNCGQSSVNSRERRDLLLQELWGRILQICSLPLRTLHDDDTFVDHELNFVHALLFHNDSTGPLLEEAVLLRLLRLLSGTLLPLGVLWRRAYLLPNLISTLLTLCLECVSRGGYSRVVLNRFSSFLFQLVKDSIHNRSRNITSSAKSLCLSSITACMFRLSAIHIDVFTTHSNDLDYLAADLLKTLKRIRLPHRRSQSAFTTHEEREESKGNKIAGAEDDGDEDWSDATLCDLSYACVGDGDGQLLLQQAAERVEEEDGNGTRHIFMVPE